MSDQSRKPARAADFYALFTAPAREETSFYQPCDGCRGETRWTLVAETATQEVYQCEGCGNEKVYTVR